MVPPNNHNNSTIQQSNNVPPILRTKFSCPSVKEFCKVGNGIIKDGKYIGWGNVLASGSAIFAAFDGNLTATSSAVEGNFKIVYLDSPSLNLRAMYFLRGRITKNGKASKGEQIAVSNGKPIEVYDNNSLIFSLIPGYPGSNNPAILNKEDFEY